jgi:hypothetical protein
MTDLNTEANNILLLSNYYVMQALLNKMQIITEQLNGNTNSQIITVSTGNLYALAAQFYGDSLQWTIIADANKLIDPEIVGIQNLIIPQWDGIDRQGEFIT